MCQNVERIVHELAKDYAGRMTFTVVKHDEGDSPQRIARYGIKVHGMVITDADDKVLWLESNHKQTKAGVSAAITKALGG